MHLEAVADELYRLPPGEFTAARNEAAKKARSHGDRQLAQQIRSLRRPTTPAWLANQLVHHHPAEMEALLDLGRELREVMAELGAEELRELTQQRYRLVSALVDQARSIASRQVGARVTDEVAQALRTTLEATLSDPGSAEAVASGHLAEALSVSGFGSMSAPEASPERTTKRSSREGTISDLDERRRRNARRRAEHDLEAAEKDERAARAAQAAAERELREATQRREETVAAVDLLQSQLAETMGALDERRTAEQAAHDQLQAAQRASEAATESRGTAHRRLQELAEPG